jgi:hypothetical protein
MMGKYIVIEASYEKYPGRRHAGNPFVEALRIRDSDKDSVLDRIGHAPAVPNASDRKLDDSIRLDELNFVNDIIYKRPAYKKLAAAVLSALKEAYYARNPITLEDKQRRHLIAIDSTKEILLPSNWKSSAKGLGVFGSSGTGKTTLCDRLSLPLQVVIRHTVYNGEALNCSQIPWVAIEIPHDATLKSLCVQFFETIDDILGNTDYQKQARATGGIAEMVLLIAKVVNAVSLGMIFVDELQNLKAARGPQIEFVLNLFSQLMQRAGVSLLVAGTPAIESFMGHNIRNIRKLTSAGETRLDAMKFGSPELIDFQDTYWDYQWVKRKGRLTDEIRKEWFAASGGNPAFTVMSFMLAQRIEIGGRELLDGASFQRVAQTDMAMLQPAIRALCTGRKAALSGFDDLIFTNRFDALRQTVRWDKDKPGRSDEDGQPPDEFGEIADAEAEANERSAHAAARGRSKKAPAKSTAHEKRKPGDIPTEDPLFMQ